MYHTIMYSARVAHSTVSLQTSVQLVGTASLAPVRPSHLTLTKVTNDLLGF